MQAVTTEAGEMANFSAKTEQGGKKHFLLFSYRSWMSMFCLYVLFYSTTVFKINVVFLWSVVKQLLCLVGSLGHFIAEHLFVALFLFTTKFDL